MPHRVINIAEHDHFADYAELQRPSRHQSRRWDVTMCMVGLVLVSITAWALIWMFIQWFR